MYQKFFFHYDYPMFSADFLQNKESRYETPQIVETEEAYLVTLDIPGVNLSDIDIALLENTLSIKADRKNLFSSENKTLKTYSHSFSLPKNIDQEKISAHFENGVLGLTIPKLSEQKTQKKIPILNGEKPKKWTEYLGFTRPEKDKIVA